VTAELLLQVVVTARSGKDHLGLPFDRLGQRFIGGRIASV
jgi:hypothetical protein